MTFTMKDKRDVFPKGKGVQCLQKFRVGGEGGETLPESKKLKFPLLSCSWPQVHLDISTDPHPQGKECYKSPFLLLFSRNFPVGSDCKASAYNEGDPGLIPGSGRCPGEGNGNPLQYSCLENTMDRGAWWATVHGVTKSWTRLSDFTFTLAEILISYLSKNPFTKMDIQMPNIPFDFFQGSPKTH